MWIYVYVQERAYAYDQPNTMAQQRCAETQNIYIDYTVPFHSIADVVHVLSTFCPSSSSPTIPYSASILSPPMLHIVVCALHTELGTTFHLSIHRKILYRHVLFMRLPQLSLTWPRNHRSTRMVTCFSRGQTMCRR